MFADPEDLFVSRADSSPADATSAGGDTASYTSEQSPVVNTRRRNKIIVRRSKSITPSPSKMRTSVSMPKVRSTFVRFIVVINIISLLLQHCLENAGRDA